MNNYSVQQLKDALINLYSLSGDVNLKAYQLCFELLEAKIGEDAMDSFLEAYNI